MEERIENREGPKKKIGEGERERESKKKKMEKRIRLCK